MISIALETIEISLQEYREGGATVLNADIRRSNLICICEQGPAPGRIQNTKVYNRKKHTEDSFEKPRHVNNMGKEKKLLYRPTLQYQTLIHEMAVVALKWKGVLTDPDALYKFSVPL
jgi:hypothetical protein